MPYDGLNGILSALSENSIETAWRYLVLSRFAERPHRKKTVLRRRRRLALALPPNRELTPEEIMVLTAETAREYASLSPRTLLRDLGELRAMEIVVEKAGKFQTNLGLLVPHMARRRVRAALA